MAAINVTRSERQALDDIVGRAMLDEKIRQDLLKQDTRHSVLSSYVLSNKVMQHLMSLNDMLDVSDFAGVLDKTIKQ